MDTEDIDIQMDDLFPDLSSGEILDCCHLWPRWKNGKPPEISSPQEFMHLFNKYIQYCIEKNERPTLKGFIWRIGLSSYQSLTNYENKPEFMEPIKRAKLYIEYQYELDLRSQSPAGAIFALKNFGWKDEQHVSHGGAMGVLDGKSPAEYAKEVMDSLAEDLEAEGN